MVLEDGRLTDEAIAEFRKGIGTTLRIPWVFNDCATKAAIKKFVNGVGDINPLWQDEDYAKKTRYGGIVAPPSWIYCVFGPALQQGLPGVHGFHAGDDLEFYKPIFMGDSIRPVVTLKDVEEKPGKFAGRMVFEYELKEYFNQHDELVSKGTALVIRTERQPAGKKNKSKKIQLPHPWTEEELKKIEDKILSEEIRGDIPRYWEDVQIKDELPPRIKGPIGMTDEMAFVLGTGAPIKAHGAALRDYRKHSALGFRDPEIHSMESVVSVHWNKYAANAAGVTYPFEVGIQRNCWLIQLLTDWMGDDGWIKSCKAEYRKFVFLSEVVWLRGEVTRKYVDDKGEHCVDIETTAFNQRSENTMTGKATVILPSKENRSFPVAKRLPDVRR